MSRAFVGFGFGPIQAGLMLLEAAASGGFDRYAVAEIDQTLVDAVRAGGNVATINIAGRDGIRTRRLEGITLYNPRVDADRRALVAAIAEARELATAVPSVALYGAGGPASIAAMLAEAVRPGFQRILYAAENNNYAAALLRAEVERLAPAGSLVDTQFLDTVVGKMSGVVSAPGEMRRLGLAPLVAGFGRCVLVEEFNRILVSRVTLPGFARGIRVFEEKDDLLPFEEAKLYGHNAVHAVLGSLARLRGHETMSGIREDPTLLALGRRVFLEESGAALIARYGATGDPLFTAEGYAAYADDLLERMTNPYLHDRVERVIRDPKRKLGWSDRFFGTMRAALEAGVEPLGMSLGAAAATALAMEAEPGSRVSPRAFLSSLWGTEAAGEARDACLSLVGDAFPRLEEWRR